MAIELGPATLWRLGYRNFTHQQVNDALHEIYGALEYAVGQRLAGQFSRRQRDEFARLSDAGRDERTLAWLEENFPSYRQVVSDEFETLERRLAGAIKLSRRQQQREPQQQKEVQE